MINDFLRNQHFKSQSVLHCEKNQSNANMVSRIQYLEFRTPSCKMCLEIIFWNLVHSNKKKIAHVFWFLEQFYKVLKILKNCSKN